MLTREYEKAYTYYKSIEPRSWIQLNINIHRFAFVYSQWGSTEEGETLFKLHEDLILNRIELARASIFDYYDLAGIYAYHGKKEEALKLLNPIRHYNSPNDWFVTLIKHDPLFDSLRQEPLFQQVMQELEAKSKTEYERVRQWLEENKML